MTDKPLDMPALVAELDALEAKATPLPWADGDFINDALRGSIPDCNFDYIMSLVTNWPRIRTSLLADSTEDARWIPVSEKLPAEKKHRTSDVCLVTDGNDRAFRHYNFAANAWVGDYLFYRVTHWTPLLPLPSPPKEK